MHYESKEQELEKIVILGASGFGKEVLFTISDINKTSKKYNVMGFIDDNKSLWNKKINGIKVLGGIDWFSFEKTKKVKCVVAIGDSKLRKKIIKKLSKSKVNFSTIIHPSVHFSKFVKIGEGTIIQAGSIITTDVKIGNHVIMNRGRVRLPS